MPFVSSPYVVLELARHHIRRSFYLGAQNLVIG
jgi:hypothetical protein